MIKEYFKSDKFKSDLKELWDTVFFVVVALIIIRFFFFEVRYIPSGSMLPSIRIGDRVIVERISRFYKVPERGDIMVFYPPATEIKNTPVKLFARLTGLFCKDTAYIKRVIGLPREKFEIKRDDSGIYTVYINDKPLDEYYVMNKFESAPCERPDVNCGPFIIPENQYMMMGDNRANSWDGRFWGTLDKDRFIGRAVFRFWPLNRIKVLSKINY